MKETIEAEMMVLGSCLLSQQACAATIERLTPDEFYYPSNRKVYEAVFAVFTRGEVVDIFALTQEMRARRTLDDVGGGGFLTQLVETTPTATQIEVYVRAVEAGAAVRRIESEANAILTLIQSGATMDSLTVSVQKLLQIPDATTARHSNKFRLSKLSDLSDQPLKPFIIEKILPANGLAAVVGTFGSYKSFLALDMALSIATGLKWQGHATERGYVVYVAAEGAGAEVNKRARGWCVRHQLSDDERFRVITDAPQITQPGDVAHLSRALQSLPEMPKLIILDTLARCMVGGDENNARDMGLFVAGLDKIRRDTGATIAIVHHTGKAGDMRGSSALPGAMDTILDVKSKERMATISCGKQKDQAAFDSITVVARIVGDGDTATLVFESSDAAPVGAVLPQRAITALAILREQFPDGATFTQWKSASEKSGIAHAAFVRSKDDLLTAKQIEHDGATKKYTARPEGEE